MYVIDVGAKDDDGNLLDRAVRAGHRHRPPSGTLRTPPLLLGPEGDGPGERWMILSQADGRDDAAARVPAAGDPDRRRPTERPRPRHSSTAAAELPVAGWAWFPPVTDGERIAVVTDFGQFRLFGVNQPGSLDKPLFPLPEPRPPLPAPPEGRAVRGLVFAGGGSGVLGAGEWQPPEVPAGPRARPAGWNSFRSGRRCRSASRRRPPQLNNRRDSRVPGRPVAELGRVQGGPVQPARRRAAVAAATRRRAGDDPDHAGGGSLLLVAEDGGLVAIPIASGAIRRASIAAARPSG